MKVASAIPGRSQAPSARPTGATRFLLSLPIAEPERASKWEMHFRREALGSRFADLEIR
jgi:hypothetical protein